MPKGNFRLNRFKKKKVMAIIADEKSCRLLYDVKPFSGKEEILALGT